MSSLAPPVPAARARPGPVVECGRPPMGGPVRSDHGKNERFKSVGSEDPLAGVAARQVLVLLAGVLGLDSDQLYSEISITSGGNIV
jgi:hypothetical protein